MFDFVVSAEVIKVSLAGRRSHSQDLHSRAAGLFGFLMALWDVADYEFSSSSIRTGLFGFLNVLWDGSEGDDVLLIQKSEFVWVLVLSVFGLADYDIVSSSRAPGRCGGGIGLRR